MRVLALSTSTPRGSAALVRDGEVVAAVAYVDLQGHAERIFEAVDAVLAQAGEPRSAVEGLGCDVGPGSFTGVRVGVASAKGMALGLGLPLAGVVSLEAMAAAAFDAAHAGRRGGRGDRRKEGRGVRRRLRRGGGGALAAPCARPLGCGGVFAGSPSPSSPRVGAVVVVGEVAEGVVLPRGLQVGAGGRRSTLPDASVDRAPRRPRGWRREEAAEPRWSRSTCARPTPRPRVPVRLDCRRDGQPARDAHGRSAPRPSPPRCAAFQQGEVHLPPGGAWRRRRTSSEEGSIRLIKKVRGRGAACPCSRRGTCSGSRRWCRTRRARRRLSRSPPAWRACSIPGILPHLLARAIPGWRQHGRAARAFASRRRRTRSRS